MYDHEVSYNEAKYTAVQRQPSQCYSTDHCHLLSIFGIVVDQKSLHVQLQKH